MAVDMQEAVKFIDEVLTEQSFMSALKDFTGTHCEVFEAVRSSPAVRARRSLCLLYTSPSPRD